MRQEGVHTRIGRKYLEKSEQTLAVVVVGAALGARRQSLRDDFGTLLALQFGQRSLQALRRAPTVQQGLDDAFEILVEYRSPTVFSGSPDHVVPRDLAAASLRRVQDAGPGEVPAPG